MKRCLVTLLPTPDAATFIQNRFKTEGCIKKWPLVRGPKQADTKVVQLPCVTQWAHLFPSTQVRGICTHIQEDGSSS